MSTVTGPGPWHSHANPARTASNGNPAATDDPTNDGGTTTGTGITTCLPQQREESRPGDLPGSPDRKAHR